MKRDVKRRVRADRKVLQARLKEARAAVGMTQRALGKSIGYSGAAVAAWESGVSCPRAEVLPEIARVLETTVEALTEAA